MPQTSIPFPWYLLIHADDETPLIASADDFDLLVAFTDLEFARLYAGRSGSDCEILEFTQPEGMVEFFEQLSDAAATVDDRPLTHVCFDPIDPSAINGAFAFEIESLVTGLKKAIKSSRP